MKRIAAYLASAALGAGLAGSGPAWAHMRSGADTSGRSIAKNQTFEREHRWHHGWQWRHRRDLAWSPGLTSRAYPYNLDNYAYNYGYPYNYGYVYPSNYAYGYGYPYASSYGYPYGYANPFGVVTAPIAALTAPVTALTAPVAAAATAPVAVAASATAPLLTGRSVATGQMGKMCSTPVKACELYRPSYIGNGCSCSVAGGRSRGTVSP